MEHLRRLLLEVFYKKKVFLKISQSSQEKNGVTELNKIAGLFTETFLGTA